MFDGDKAANYIKTNLANDNLMIYSLKDSENVSKKNYAEEILKNGIVLDKNSKLANILCPKGLVKDVQSIQSTITNKTYYHEKDVCNIIISSPQVLEFNGERYYIGYPKDNISGYSTAEHQTDYNCFLTDYLEYNKSIFNKMVFGYYYCDSEGNTSFKHNEKHYSQLNEKDRTDFFTYLLEKMDDKISSTTSKKEILNYIKDTIKDKKCDNNSKYLTALEYIEYQNSKLDKILLNREEFKKIVLGSFSEYALYMHGVDQNPKFSRITVDYILRSALHIDEEYGFCGTCEPMGLVSETESLDKDLNYNYGDNKEESYNIIILTPKIIEDMDLESYFVGYSRKNTTGTFPKSMKDFDCLFTDLINNLGYIPREFIFAYQKYGPGFEDEFYINPYHISFLNDDLQRIFFTKFLNIDNRKLRDNLNVFALNNINEELIEAYTKSLIEGKKMPSMQTTALEYFENKNKVKTKCIEYKDKGMLK